MIAQRRAAASSGCLVKPKTRCFVNGKTVSRFSIVLKIALPVAFGAIVPIVRRHPEETAGARIVNASQYSSVCSPLTWGRGPLIPDLASAQRKLQNAFFVVVGGYFDESRVSIRSIVSLIGTVVPYRVNDFFDTFLISRTNFSRGDSRG